MKEPQQDKTYWLEHKSAWERSGLSQRRYSAQEGLCNRKFNYHVKKLEQQSNKTRFKFIEATSTISAKSPVGAQGSIDVRLANGVVVAVTLSAEMTLAQVFELAGAL